MYYLLERVVVLCQQPWLLYLKTCKGSQAPASYYVILLRKSMFDIMCPSNIYYANQKNQELK